MRHKGEDYRYRQFRENWESVNKTWAPYLIAYFQVFFLQAIFQFFINSSALYVCLRSPDNDLQWNDYLGAAVWLFGQVFEIVADMQMAKFRKENGGKGLIIQTGLWRFSRHPNYFGEATLWWGIWIIACSVDYGWATFFSALLITLLIRFVSGVPYLEKASINRKGWDQYCQQTNCFVPWFVRKVEKEKK